MDDSEVEEGNDHDLPDAGRLSPDILYGNQLRIVNYGLENNNEYEREFGYSVFKIFQGSSIGRIVKRRILLMSILFFFFGSALTILSVLQGHNLPSCCQFHLDSSRFKLLFYRFHPSFIKWILFSGDLRSSVSIFCI
jgi:hypothetical protein